ncbi:MAG: hypothetical protein ACREVB_10075, partial [Burkholderiales bacterium]
ARPVSCASATALTGSPEQLRDARLLAQVEGHADREDQRRGAEIEKLLMEKLERWEALEAKGLYTPRPSP